MCETDKQLTLALIGAGAVVEKRYLPATSRTEGLRVTRVVDIDVDQARRLADSFGIEATASDYRAVLGEVDAIVIATPPATHAQIVVDALDAGVHVLCEKPMATAVAEGETMVAAAAASSALLSVAMVRRVSEGARVMKRFLELGLLGQILRVEAEEGGEFNWPLRTGHVFQDTSEGGVLRDTGTHILDLVLWLTGGSDTRIDRYTDDSWGGAEANARVDFSFGCGGSDVEASVEVSFTRNLRNRIRVLGQAGRLEVATSGGIEAVFEPAGHDRLIVLRPDGATPGSRTDDFVRQLQDFESAVREDRPPPVPAEQALETLRLIDGCYARRVRKIERWQDAPSPAGRS